MRRAVESGHVVGIEGAWGKIPPLAKKNLDIMPRLAGTVLAIGLIGAAAASKVFVGDQIARNSRPPA